MVGCKWTGICCRMVYMKKLQKLISNLMESLVISDFLWHFRSLKINLPLQITKFGIVTLVRSFFTHQIKILLSLLFSMWMDFYLLHVNSLWMMTLSDDGDTLRVGCFKYTEEWPLHQNGRRFHYTHEFSYLSQLGQWMTLHQTLAFYDIFPIRMAAIYLLAANTRTLQSHHSARDSNKNES